MKKGMLLFASLLFCAVMFAQEFKIVTIVESIVPAGAGRSRMIEPQQEMNASLITTERNDEKGGKQKDIKRSELKIDDFSETKLLNFYSAVGINFQNISTNDAIISSKINQMIQQGWNLTYVTSGVEADAGKDDGTGIFITRLFFSRN